MLIEQQTQDERRKATVGSPAHRPPLPRFPPHRCSPNPFPHLRTGLDHTPRPPGGAAPGWVRRGRCRCLGLGLQAPNPLAAGRLHGRHVRDLLLVDLVDAFPVVCKVLPAVSTQMPLLLAVEALHVLEIPAPRLASLAFARGWRLLAFVLAELALGILAVALVLALLGLPLCHEADLHGDGLASGDRYPGLQHGLDLVSYRVPSVQARSVKDEVSLHLAVVQALLDDGDLELFADPFSALGLVLRDLVLEVGDGRLDLLRLEPVADDLLQEGRVP